MVLWHFKGTPPIPVVPPKPRPPSPPSPPPHPPAPPPPAPPAPFPEPAQLKCVRWNATREWSTVGCDVAGTNCAVIIEVHNSSSSKNSSKDNNSRSSNTATFAHGVAPPSASAESWSMLTFVPPKQMRLAAANVIATVTASAASTGFAASVGVGSTTGTGSAVVTLSSNATALYVVLTTQASGRFQDNAVLLEKDKPLTIAFVPWGDAPLDLALLESTLRVEHLADNL